MNSIYMYTNQFRYHPNTCVCTLTFETVTKYTNNYHEIIRIHVGSVFFDFIWYPLTTHLHPQLYIKCIHLDKKIHKIMSNPRESGSPQKLSHTNLYESKSFTCTQTSAKIAKVVMGCIVPKVKHFSYSIFAFINYIKL